MRRRRSVRIGHDGTHGNDGKPAGDAVSRWRKLLARGSTGDVPELHDPLGAHAPAGGDRTLSARTGPAARGRFTARRFRQFVQDTWPPWPGRIRVCAGTTPRSRCCRGLARPAQLAEMRRDIPEAIRCWEKVQETSRKSSLSPADQILMGESADEALADLRKGIIPPSEPPAPTVPAASKPSKGASSDTGQRKVGRNEPCPCGSGKKYKQCHGRKG